MQQSGDFETLFSTLFVAISHGWIFISGSVTKEPFVRYLIVASPKWLRKWLQKWLWKFANSFTYIVSAARMKNKETNKQLIS